MKKILYSLSVFLLTVVWANAQVVLLNDEGEDISNLEITVSGTTDDDYFKVQIYISNQGEDEVEVFVRKHEIDIVEGAYSAFCWNGYCFSPFVFDVEEPILLGNDQTSAADDFYVEFTTGNVAGTSQVMFEFYNDDESFETVTVQINFEISTPTSTEIITNPSQWRLEDARPNPARDHTWINFQVPANARNASIVVRNLLGNAVINENLRTSDNRLRLDTSGLSNGIYIYSLVIDNQVVQSKRLVVAN